jgi:quercetin dioxygenase-like cupin family protein
MRAPWVLAPLVTLCCAVPAFADGTDTAATVAPQFAHGLPDMPGKSLKVVTVTYAPGAASPPHRHGGFVYAYVLSGKIRTQVEGEPEKVLGPG